MRLRIKVADRAAEGEEKKKWYWSADRASESKRYAIFHPIGAQSCRDTGRFDDDEIVSMIKGPARGGAVADGRNDAPIHNSRGIRPVEI